MHPPRIFCFKTDKLTKSINPITATQNRIIITISGYLIYFGTFLLLLISITPSKINSKTISIKKSIVGFSSGNLN